MRLPCLKLLLSLVLLLSAGCALLSDPADLINPWGGGDVVPGSGVLVGGPGLVEGGQAWVGHHIDEVREAYGDPDFAVITPLNDIAYVYFRLLAGPGGEACYYAYLVDLAQTVTAVYCR